MKNPAISGDDGITWHSEQFRNDRIRCLPNERMVKKEQCLRGRDRAAALSKVPDSIARTQYEMSGDVQRLLARRVQIADVIEAIDAETSADKDK